MTGKGRPGAVGRTIGIIILILAADVLALYLVRLLCIRQGDQAQARDDINRASSSYATAQAIYPPSPLVRTKRSDLLFKDGQWSLALDEIAPSCTAWPEDLELKVRREGLKRVIKSMIHDMAPMRFFEEYTRLMQKKRTSVFLAPLPVEIPATEQWDSRRQDVLQFQISIMYNFFLGDWKGKGFLISSGKAVPCDAHAFSERALGGHFVIVLERAQLSQSGKAGGEGAQPSQSRKVTEEGARPSESGESGGEFSRMRMWVIGYDPIGMKSSIWLFSSSPGHLFEQLERLPRPILNPDQYRGTCDGVVTFPCVFIPDVNAFSISLDVMKPGGPYERVDMVHYERDLSCPPSRLPDSLFDAKTGGAAPEGFPGLLAGKWKGRAVRGGKEYEATALGGPILGGRFLLLSLTIHTSPRARDSYREYLVFGIPPGLAQGKAWCFTSEGLVNAFDRDSLASGVSFRATVRGARPATGPASKHDEGAPGQPALESAPFNTTRVFTSTREGELEMTVLAGSGFGDPAEVFKVTLKKEGLQERRAIER